MRLIWFQRPDGRWNADCACGGSCCGIQFEERAQCEGWHFEYVAKERKRGTKRPPCGPKFPDENINMPGPFIFP